MSLVWHSMLGALALASIATAVYYAVALYRIVHGQMKQPTLRDARRLAQSRTEWPRLLVVVPAHNEEAIIEQCARTLLASDYPDLRVVFALDRCTDGTAGVIERVRASYTDITHVDVQTIEYCPDDWAGKTHAMHRGYRDSAMAAGAALVLFCDADTSFEPDCLRAAVALMLDGNMDMLSLLPTLTCTTWFERIVQPAAGLELVRQFPLDKVNAPGSRRHFANGQFMLWKRETFDAIGGHERVKSELLEDIALARALHKPIDGAEHVHGHRAGCFMADGLMRCRMYGSWPAFQRGWKRIYAEAARRYPAQIRRHARRVRLLASVLPAASVTAIVAGVLLMDRVPELASITIATGAAGCVAFALALGLVYRAQHTNLIWMVFYPVGAWCLAKIMHEAAHDLEHNRPTQWAGRTYQRSRAAGTGETK